MGGLFGDGRTQGGEAVIFCVEDDESIREIEIYTLRATGFTARGFSDGLSFWRALGEGLPELVVLDVMLPGLDGIELLRRRTPAGRPRGDGNRQRYRI